MAALNSRERMSASVDIALLVCQSNHMATSTQALTPVRTPEALGRAIRRARTDRGWTQHDLAARIVASRQHVIDLEAGHQTRAVESLLDALAALDLELVV